jgi:hypothetical protein
MMSRTQVALRLDEDIIEIARRTAERQNRSLANFVEVALSEALLLAEGERPILSAVDADLSGIEALNDDGTVDPDETAVLRDLVAIARR